MLSEKDTVLYISSLDECDSGARISFKGCPLRCKWCITPEARTFGQELTFDIDSCTECGLCRPACGVGMQKMKPSRIYDRSFCVCCGNCVPACPHGLLKLVRREVTAGEAVAFAKNHGGRLLVTGGEPTAQPGGLKALLQLAREEGIMTSVETCGAFESGFAETLASLAGEVVFDIKDHDPARFRADTRGDLSAVLSNLVSLSASGAKITLHCTLIPGYNDSPAFAAFVAKIYGGLLNARGITLSPYSAEAVKKARLVDIFNSPRFAVPTAADMQNFADMLYNNGVPKNDISTSC